MPVRPTPLYRLRQPNALGVCQCGGLYPNGPVVGVAEDPRYPPGATFPVAPGSFYDDTPEGADDLAQDYGDDQAGGLLEEIIDELEEWAIAASLVCKKKSGDATHCGFGEYEDISDPPMYFRRQQMTGTIRADFYVTSPSDCSIPKPGEYSDFTQSGSWLYDPDTCEETNTQNRHLAQWDGYMADEVIPKATNLFSVGGGSANTHEIDRIEQRLFGNGSCYGATVWSGELKASLLDEDTAEDAEGRALAEIENWTYCGDAPGCMDVTCSAFRTDRTGGVDNFFGFRSVETQASWMAGPLCSYNLTIRFARRLLGSGGPFLELGLIYEATITAGTVEELAMTGGIVTSEWVPVPNEAGWETRANSCLVELIPG
jgi:hypothetical protein